MDDWTTVCLVQRLQLFISIRYIQYVLAECKELKAVNYRNIEMSLLPSLLKYASK